jgi:hypothetical protein
MWACKNLSFDICYWTENLAKTWLISVVVYVRTFATKISVHLLNIPSITAGEPTPEAFESIRILTIIPDFDTFKTFR